MFLMILDSVRNISIEPLSDMYAIGDQLECAANGNPKPQARWTQVAPQTQLINASTLTLYTGMEGTQTWTCYVENVVRNNVTWLERNVTFTVCKLHRFVVQWACTFSMFCDIL